MAFCPSEKTPLLRRPKLRNVETEADYRRRWFSLTIGFIATFVLSFQSSIFWASMYPYLRQIDSTSTESFFGFVMAAQAFGAAISAPLLGFLSKKIHSFKIPVLLGFSMNLIGNFLIAFVENVPHNRKWVLLVARLFGGLGIGCRSVISAYTMMSTTLEERNKGLSIQASSASVAIMIGPGIQAASVAIGYPGYSIGPLKINMFTAPALISTVLVITLSVLIVLTFKEYHMDVLDHKLSKHGSDMPPFDKLAAFCCALTRFCILFCITYDGTIGSPLTMTMFKWTPKEAVLYNGILIASVGVVDFLMNLFVGNFLLKYVKERVIILIGLCSFYMFYVISFAYPVLLPSLESEIGTLEVSSSNLTHNAGCSYGWCNYTTRIYVAQYIAAYVFIAFALPLSYTPSVILLSKVIGPRHQGLATGINMCGGYVALILSPILVSYVFQWYGPRVAWAIGSSVLAFGIIFNTLNFKNMLPYDRSRITKRISVTSEGSCRSSIDC